MQTSNILITLACAHFGSHICCLEISGKDYGHIRQAKWVPLFMSKVSKDGRDKIIYTCRYIYMYIYIYVNLAPREGTKSQYTIITIFNHEHVYNLGVI